MTRFHQVELVGSERSTAVPDRSLEVVMKIEQPSLGRIGVDSFTLTADWHWEGGWTLRTSSRLSGSSEFRGTTYEALSDDELLELIQVIGAEHLGLV